MTKRTCSIDRCPNTHYARGWCTKHYKRWAKTGDPLTPARKYRGGPNLPGIEPAERLWSKIEKSPDGCWDWRGGKDPGGYGTMTNRKKQHKAHRFVYELIVGPIPDGLQLDHLCRNRGCVNPAHLDPVTCLENIRRGEGHGSETHCPQGHHYEGANLRVYKGRRYCRTCVIERAAAWRAARRAA
jgi:hypothetical protein